VAIVAFLGYLHRLKTMLGERTKNGPVIFVLCAVQRNEKKYYVANHYVFTTSLKS